MKKNNIFIYIVIVLIFILIKFFIVDIVNVNGDSMNPSLNDGDILLLNKKASINRFDIVVIKWNKKFIIKRVIGMPNETLKIVDGNVYVNNNLLKFENIIKDFCNYDEIKLKNDQYFVLGDNRENSIDSRSIGAISRSNIVGVSNSILLSR